LANAEAANLERHRTSEAFAAQFRCVRIESRANLAVKSIQTQSIDFSATQFDCEDCCVATFTSQKKYRVAVAIPSWVACSSVVFMAQFTTRITTR
jgi:hypothetical protein